MEFAGRLLWGSCINARRYLGRRHRKLQAAYGPDFPVVSIVEAHPGCIMTKEQLEAMGLLAAPEAETANSQTATTPRRTGPSDYRPQRTRPVRTTPPRSPTHPGITPATVPTGAWRISLVHDGN